MSIASVVPSYVFGLRSTGHNSISFVDEGNTIIYAAGANIVEYNLTTKSQKLIPNGTKSSVISCITVSGDKSLVAVADKCANTTANQHGTTQPNAKPCINIYALPDFRKRKTLAIEDLQGSAADLKEDVISMNFSADSKYLALLSASNTLSFWLWDKTRCFAAAKIPLHSDVKYSRSESKQLDRLTISVNPFDDSQTVVVAEGLFRHLTISEANVKISKAIEGLQRSLVTCHAWISADRSAVATSTGSIHIIEHTSATIKNTISISVPASTDNGANPKPTSPSIDSLHVTAQSLVVVCPGSVHLFDRVKSDDEQHESTENYKATKTINLNFEQTRIKGTALAGNVLIITDQDNQTISVNVSSAVDTKKPEDNVPKLVLPKAHHGAITGLAACVRKPLVATCSTDKSIRVWNYITRTLEITKYFAEEPLSVSIHPSGLYLIAGFTDKLRMMSILTDDLRVYRELSVRGCRECAFSSGGQFLAAAQGSVISLYSTWSFEVLATLKGHNGKIRSLYWSLDDTKLVSAGSDGAVYTWTVKDLKRENECIIKSCSYSSAVCGSVNDRTVFAVGTDKMLKEITDSVVVRELQSSVGLTQVLISNSGKMMFVSTVLGTVKAVRFPLPTDLTDLDADELAQEHQAHGVPVTKLRISFDDRYLFSACEDGFIYIYRITDRDTKNTRGQPLEVTFAEEVLVTKTDLEEKNSSIIELKNRMEELKIEHDYQIRLKDMHLQEKMKELTTELAKVIESLRLQTAVLRAEKDKEDTKHREDYELLMNKNRQEYRDAENKNNNKLMAEFEKYNVLQEESRQKQRYWDENFKLSEQNRTVECHQLSQIYDDKLRIKAQELSKLLEDMKYQTREHQECQKQISEDIDSEIRNQENMYENILKTELDLCLRLKGENGIMKKRFLTFNKEIEDSKNEIIRLKENETKLRKVLVTLEKEMSNKRREMAERDKSIQDQEKRMYELKKKNQELEKFRFVLDFKIKHLKTQIEPKEQEISNMTKQISEINEALESLHRSERIMIEERQILQDSLTTAKDDYRNEYRRKRELIHLIKQIQTDLTYAIDFIQDPAVLKKSVENLHVKYCQKMPPNPPPLVDQPAAKENERQVRYLQNSITRLRQEADTQAKTFRQNNLNLVKQNLELIHEVKKLRAIKMGKVEVTDLTHVLNTLPALPMSSRGKEEIAVDMSANLINENGDTTVEGTQNGTNEEIILRLPQLAI